MKIQFINYSGCTIHEREIPDDTPEIWRVRLAAELSVRAGANLAGASFVGANLIGANLAGANLAGAYFNGACLAGARLVEHTKLIGERPVLQIGPIGSRGAYLAAYVTDRGVLVRAGCFFDTLTQFEMAVQSTHGSNAHGREYTAAVTLIRAHAEIWTPAAQPAAAE